MSLLKIVFALLSIGSVGASYALFRIERAPFSLRASAVVLALATVALATAAIITALPELPRGVDGIRLAFQKISEALPKQSGATPAVAEPTPLPPTELPNDKGPPLITEKRAAPATIEALPDPTPSRAPMVSEETLQITEGATFELKENTTYHLNAPLGHTVRYRLTEGEVILLRDGEVKRVYSHGFKTFARVSKFSVIPSTSTASISIVAIDPGNTF